MGRTFWAGPIKDIAKGTMDPIVKLFIPSCCILPSCHEAIFNPFLNTNTARSDPTPTCFELAPSTAKVVSFKFQQHQLDS